ncbi:MAG: DNA alkylation repair protein [Paludibacter sp.]|nr:DNA alkylation repair protein [Paludibacter sp.]
MSNLLKDRYSTTFFDSFTEILKQIITDFDKEKFLQLIYDNNWERRELKDRMKHISRTLHEFFPAEFAKTVGIIGQIIETLKQQNITGMGLEYMFLPDYIETYGIDAYEYSVECMEFVTPFTSCEFAVRPFIIKYGDRMLNQMQRWSLHENPHVRRLASEGSRPRLPWAMALPELKTNPTPVLPILENLKNDSSAYVRKSVANNLNDISKDHPELVISIAKKWSGLSKETDDIIKHACRTLLKQGNHTVLKHFGHSANANIVISQFFIYTPVVGVGQRLEFSFEVLNNDNKNLNVRLEYGVYYLRNNGQHSKKVFKISERQLNASQKIEIKRHQSFKPITTRRFYPGKHKLSIIINGEERDAEMFELVR